ncbi:hypothetical protein [Porphyromonas levii]|uniref:hypothetical protein n=1 Tax=Porphyromonas levii TaxID=28114 RepID=UPI00036EF5C7|nr:hypothetical protein [Porphyromonas levii]
MDKSKSYIEDSTHKETELSSLGIYFARGGVVELLTLQSVESVATNDWQEEHGLEIDPKTIRRTCPYINLRFIVVGETREVFAERLSAFRKLLDSYYLILHPAKMEGGYHIDNVSIEGYKHLGKSLYQKGMKVAEITIRCRLKNDSLSYYLATNLEGAPLSRIVVGNNDLSKFGVQVQEAYNTLLQPSSFKEGTFKRRSKEVSLNCVSIADSYQHLEHQLNYLYYHIKNEELYLSHGAGEERCYYTSMTNVRELNTKSKKAIAFTLNFKTT